MRYWTPIAKLAIGIPSRTLRGWCQEGKVKAKKLGKIWYVHLPDLNRQFRILEKATGDSGENSD